jgi:hypothetical protein
VLFEGLPAKRNDCGYPQEHRNGRFGHFKPRIA